MDIFYAARKNLITEIATILTKGENINQKDQFGNTALHYSISEQNEQTAIFLLEKGANVNVQDSEGGTPLHWAVEYNLHNIVKRILEIDSTVINVIDQYGNNPLWTAVLKPKINYDIVKLLLKAGANRHHKNNVGRSVIDVAFKKENNKLIEILQSNLL